jgi:phosphoglycerate dehydrogenase-like enzyme
VVTTFRTDPRIWVCPEGKRDLEDAVRVGGGRVVAAEAANAIVTVDDDIDRLRSSLHPGIRWVQVGAAGIDWLLDAGVVDDERVWTAAKGVHARPMAEHTIGLILAAARDFAGRFRAHSWGDRGGRLLAGSTVGIVGCGSVGRALLQLLAPFDVETLALTRSGRNVPGADDSLGPDGLDQLPTESDYVVLAAPATPATASMISADQLALMRPRAWLVNVSRGVLVDTEALVDVLEAGRLGGAALDVTDPEPLPDDHPLWRLPNVMITPHVASTPEMAGPALRTRVRENVARFARGEELIGVVDVAAGY